MFYSNKKITILTFCLIIFASNKVEAPKISFKNKQIVLEIEYDEILNIKGACERMRLNFIILEL